MQMYNQMDERHRARYGGRSMEVPCPFWTCHPPEMATFSAIWKLFSCPFGVRFFPLSTVDRSQGLHVLHKNFTSSAILLSFHGGFIIEAWLITSLIIGDQLKYSIPLFSPELKNRAETSNWLIIWLVPLTTSTHLRLSRSPPRVASLELKIYRKIPGI